MASLFAIMRETRFFKFSLLLPLAVPAITAPLLFVDFHLPEWLGWVALYTTYSGLIGGIPYLVSVGLLFWWARGKSDTQFKRALTLLPVLMLPVFAVLLSFGLLVEAWLRKENALPVSDALVMLLFFVPFLLGFGYFYVLLVFATARILRRRGSLLPARAIQQEIRVDSQ